MGHWKLIIGPWLRLVPRRRKALRLNLSKTGPKGYKLVNTRGLSELRISLSPRYIVTIADRRIDRANATTIRDG